MLLDMVPTLTSLTVGVVKEMDSGNDLTFLRMRTKKNEIMIAPDKDYLIAVIYKKAA